MKIIEYAKLATFLAEEEGLNPVSAYRDIQKVRALSTDLQEAVLCVLNGGIPDIVVGDVSFSELTEKDGMKPIRAILMLDWLRREPAVATRYMASQRWCSPIKTLTNDEKQMVIATLKKLKREVPENIQEDISDIKI